jgi:hypothetical protein
MSDLVAAQATYETVREDWPYTNILSMNYNFKKGFPGAESPWTEVLVGGKV